MTLAFFTIGRFDNKLLLLLGSKTPCLWNGHSDMGFLTVPGPWIPAPETPQYLFNRSMESAPDPCLDELPHLDLHARSW